MPNSIVLERNYNNEHLNDDGGVESRKTFSQSKSVWEKHTCKKISRWIVYAVYRNSQLATNRCISFLTSIKSSTK